MRRRRSTQRDKPLLPYHEEIAPILRVIFSDLWMLGGYQILVGSYED